MVDLEEGRVLKDLRIAGKGKKGNPFVTYKGLIVFINGPTPDIGERVHVRVTKVGTTCAWGEIERVSIW